MAKTTFSDISIKGIAGVVPKTRVDNMKAHPELTDSDKAKIIKLTGIREYRKAGKEICASDLCRKAAEILFEKLSITSSTIDAILFISQTPDYRLPSTACLLQNILSCPTSTLAFDINLGCSGFVYGLYTACSLIQGGGLKRVLLLCGDTQTKLCYEEDKNVNSILGDAGTAIIVEADSGAQEIKICLMTDGSRYDKLMVPAGGFRMPSTDGTRKIIKQPDGGIRSLDYIFMDGIEIFNFSVTDVVASIKSFMTEENIDVADMDYLILHQANKFMTDKISKKLRFPPEKTLYSLEEFGNTSCASIPLTIAKHFSEKIQNGQKRCMLSGFGVGLSWGVAEVFFDNICCPMILEI